MNVSVFLLSLCQALLVTGNVLLVSVVGLVGKSLAPNPALTTLPVAAQFSGLLFAAIVASLIMRRLGRKNGFYIGSTVGITGALLCAFALNQQLFYLFTLGTFTIGIGVGFGNYYRFAAVEICHEEQKSRAISFVMAGGVIAALAGPQLAIYSQHWFGQVQFTGAFIALFILYCFALLIMFFIRFPAAIKSDVEGPARSLAEIMRQPRFITAVVVGMVAYVVMNLLMTATPLAMHRMGYSFEQSAFVIEWHVLGMFAPSFFTGNLIKRFGMPTIMYTGTVFMIACILINLSGTTEWHFWMALICLGVGWNFMFITATQMVTTTHSDSEKAKTQSTNEFMVFSLVIVSAVMAGWMESQIGWQSMNWFALPIVLTAVVVIYFFSQKDEARIAEPLTDSAKS